jgi:hypothetical protein
MSGNTLLVGKVLAGTALTANNLYVETSDPDPAVKSVASSFTATGGETTVDIEYVPGQLSVYLNGIKLLDTTDYTAINGTSIALSSALAAEDVVDFVALSVFSVGDHVPASSGGTFIGEVTLSANTTAEHILPSTDDTYDLGSPSKQWQNVYTGDLHLKNERGSWTVIEEENYLTLRNNNTNKVYKLVMEEI